jgi:GAF domain-containing protein
MRKSYIVIIGFNREGNEFLQSILSDPKYEIVRMIHPDHDSLDQIPDIPNIDILIDCSNDPAVKKSIGQMDLVGINVLDPMGARQLLFNKTAAITDQHAFKQKMSIFQNLEEIITTLELTMDPDKLLNFLLDIAIKFTEADTGSIMLLKENRQVLFIAYSKGLDSETVKNTRQHVGIGIAGQVAATCKSILISGSPKATDLKKDLERQDLISAICIPLITDNELIGVMSLNSKTKKKTFSEGDLYYTEQLGEIIAKILQTSLKVALSTYKDSNAGICSNIKEIMSMEFPFNERLNLVLLRINNALNGVTCNYYDFDQKIKRFFLRLSASFHRDLLAGKRIMLNEKLASRIKRPDGVLSISAQLDRQGLNKWYLAVPVVTGGNVAGAIFLHLQSERDSMKEETALLMEIAEILSRDLKSDWARYESNLSSVKHSAISEASFSMMAIKNAEQLGKLIVSHACLVLGAETCIFRLFKKGSKLPPVKSTFSLRGSAHVDSIADLDRRISTNVYEEKKTLFLPDVQDSPFKKQAKSLVKSALSIPMIHKGNVRGILTIYDKNSTDFFESGIFTTKDMGVVTNLVTQAAKVLDNLSFFPEKLIKKK